MNLRQTIRFWVLWVGWDVIPIGAEVWRWSLELKLKSGGFFLCDFQQANSEITYKSLFGVCHEILTKTEKFPLLRNFRWNSTILRWG